MGQERTLSRFGHRLAQRVELARRVHQGRVDMDILLLLVFLSAGLATAAVLFFVWTVRARTFDQADRLALLPLRDDAGVALPAEGRAAAAQTRRTSPARERATHTLSFDETPESAAERD